MVKNSPLNISVYAVDTHEDKSEWKQFVAAQETALTHTFLTSEMSNVISDAFLLYSVPVVVLVDSELNIISRFAPFDDILPKFSLPILKTN